jgi:hypothetical protein
MGRCDCGGVPIRRLRRRSVLRRAGGLLLLIALLVACRDLTTANQTAGHRRGTAPSASAPPPASTLLSPAAALTWLTGQQALPRRPWVAGYDRDCGHGHACSFGEAWAYDTSGSGCNTRQDLLRASMIDIVYRPGSHCSIESGHLPDPYTGTTVSFNGDNPDAVEVDHVLPLATAWALGASRWSQAQRDTFANDRSVELLAVDRASNQAKGDSGPGEPGEGWMPPDRAYWCSYDARFTTILAKYRLPVVAADKSAMTSVLRTCS